MGGDWPVALEVGAEFPFRNICGARIAVGDREVWNDA
jgi:hypothetical protein